MELMVSGGEVYWSRKRFIKMYQNFNVRHKGRKETEWCGTCRASSTPLFQLDGGLRDAVNFRALSFSPMLYHLKDTQNSSCKSWDVQLSASASCSHLGLGSVPEPPEKFQLWWEEGKGQEVKLGLGRCGEGMGEAAGVWQCQRKEERGEKPRRARLSLCTIVLNSACRSLCWWGNASSFIRSADWRILHVYIYICAYIYI